MKKPVYYVILALLVGVFLFAAYKVGSYYLEKYRSDKVISEANRFVTLPGDSDNNDPTQDPSGDPECPTVPSSLGSTGPIPISITRWSRAATTTTTCATCWTAPGTTTAASSWTAPTAPTSPTRTA